MKRCLHQFIRPKRKDLAKHEDAGECVECEYDEEENRKCKRYTPIGITVVNIEQNIKEK